MFVSGSVKGLFSYLTMFSLQSENEIQELSGRLHDYMHRLRDIKTGNLHLEVANFNKVCKLT